MEVTATKPKHSKKWFFLLLFCLEEELKERIPFNRKKRFTFIQKSFLLSYKVKDMIDQQLFRIKVKGYNCSCQENSLA